MTTDGYGQAYQQGFESTVRFLLSRGASSRENAEESAQAAWVKGWERLHQLRNEDTVGHWVNTIALNVHRSLIRKEASIQPLPEPHSPQLCSTRVTIALAAIDAARILNLCRPRVRTLLEQQMRGFTPGEMASKHGVTETAIRIRLMRARRDARSCLESKAVQIKEALRHC